MKLHVTNLSPKTTEQALKGLFEQFGTVAAVEIEWFQKAGRASGNAIVQMDIIGAKEAAKKLNGRPFCSRRLYINELDGNRPANRFGVPLKARSKQTSN